eukprot:gene19866-25818_t
MIFEFFRQRSEEGIAQIQNIASKTLEGKFTEALSDSAEYIKKRQLIDAENLKKLTNGLSRSRDRLLSGITGAFNDENSIGIESRLEKLEEVLLQADIGASTTNTIINDLREYAKSEGLKVDDILPILRERLIQALSPELYRGINFTSPESGEPTIIFVIGANGMGKTTTIGKIASRLKNEANLTVLLGACDTFRAAAVEQLGEWAIRANVSIEVPLGNERGGDPVPVVRRSVRRAIDEKFDVCIIDTSGRLSNNFELTQQLQDMKKAIQDELPSAPHETLLVVDGTVGRNAVDQAFAWRKYVGVSGLVVTKLDGTARGGFVISVVRDLGFPVKFIGVGEKIDDLRDFQPEMFVDALLGNDQNTASQLKDRANKMMAFLNINNDSYKSNSDQTSNPATRLKSSFLSNEPISSNSNNIKITLSDKPKRPKRPKPQQVIKKSKGK